jgi:hypothetical protein
MTPARGRRRERLEVDPTAPHEGGLAARPGSISPIANALDCAAAAEQAAYLDTKLRQFLTQGPAGRVLPFDQAEGDACADIRAHRRRMGNPIMPEDGMVAAIARLHGAPVATRDVGGLDGASSTRGKAEPSGHHRRTTTGRPMTAAR